MQQQSAQPQPAQAQQPSQVSQPAQQQSGPPYVYDPNGTYADPNVQAWATYYAQGGKDLTGAVYFISIPGVTEGSPQPAPQEHTQPTQQQHSRSQSQVHNTVQNAAPAPAGGDGYQSFPGPGQQPTSDAAGLVGPSQPEQTHPDQFATHAPSTHGTAPSSPTSGSHPQGWAIPPHAQAASDPNLPNNQQQQAYQPPSASPAQSFHSAPPQAMQTGWQAQFNAMQHQMGAMEIGADGHGQHPGQQQTQQAYQGVGAPA